MPQFFRGRSASSRTAFRPSRFPLVVAPGLVGLSSSHFAVTARSWITIHGSDTILSLNRAFAAACAKREPWVNLAVSGGGSGRGITALLGVSRKGVERAPFLVPERMLNLGHALHARRLDKGADLGFGTFQRVDPDPAIARGIDRVRRSRR